MVNLNDPPLPGSAENLIAYNFFRDNVVDLVQAATSGPNTWTHNCFDSFDSLDWVDIEASQDCQGFFRRGDFNSDGKADLADPIAILNHLFSGGESPNCTKTADADDSGAVDLGDSVYLLNYLFSVDGLEPPAPFPSCGYDPTDDSLDCAEYRPCE